MNCIVHSNKLIVWRGPRIDGQAQIDMVSKLYVLLLFLYRDKTIKYIYVTPPPNDNESPPICPHGGAVVVTGFHFCTENNLSTKKYLPHDPQSMDKKVHSNLTRQLSYTNFN